MLDAVTLIREPLDCAWTPAEVVQALVDEPLPFALVGAWAGGGAIVGSDPLAVAGDAELAAGQDPFAVLDQLPQPVAAVDAPEGTVGGGWFGWLGYRLAATVERVPLSPTRPVPMPELQLGYYDNVLRRDPDGRWWFEALAAPERRAELDTRLQRLRRQLATAPPLLRYAPAPPPLTLAPGAAAAHRAAVQACRERIAAGEIFQANLCLRLQADWDAAPTRLLATALQRIQPPYAALVQTPEGSVVSLSPELFLRRRGETVVTGPIKGTTARTGDGESDTAALARLRASAKDAAEHVMIVDLMRNDLGRVCEYGSVQAPKTPDAQAHPGLWHLVSHVRGRLAPEVSHAQLLRATFPPGSVTGAPKVQALHVIAQLESSCREVYTGAIGYSSPIAGLELSVAIRTLELRHGHLWFGAGGGVVADSEPDAELAEALAKAAPIARAIGSSVTTAETAAPAICVEPVELARRQSLARRIPAPALTIAPDPAQGVYETVLVRDGRIQALDAHLDRLQESTRALYELQPPTGLAEQVRAEAARLTGEHRLRIDAIPSDGRKLLIAVRTTPVTHRVQLHHWAPVTARGGYGEHKWADRGQLGSSASAGSGPVPVLIDGETVLEAGWANVWLLDGARLITPPADGRILPGVTRARLLSLAPSLGLTVAEAPFTLGRALGAPALILTSSIALAAGAVLDGAPDPPARLRRRIEEIHGALAATGWD